MIMDNLVQGLAQVRSVLAFGGIVIVDWRLSESSEANEARNSDTTHNRMHGAAT
jgi:hypothetical protein